MRKAPTPPDLCFRFKCPSLCALKFLCALEACILEELANLSCVFCRFYNKMYLLAYWLLFCCNPFLIAIANLTLLDTRVKIRWRGRYKNAPSKIDLESQKLPIIVLEILNIQFDEILSFITFYNCAPPWLYGISNIVHSTTSYVLFWCTW